MNGRPKASTGKPCTGIWACSVEQDGRHCVCVQDTPAHRPVKCCNCDYEVKVAEED